MVSAGDFRNGVTFEMDGDVYQIIQLQHVKPGKGPAFVRTKIRNVIAGSVVERTFNPTEKFPTAYIERKEMEYSYNDGDLYYFMESIKNVYDFSKEEGFPRTYFVYDTEEKDFFRYIIYNGDYSYKKEFYMVMLTPINSKGELWATINAFDLCEDYKKGKLKGKLKEVAATLEEDDNRVIMLVKHKK